MFHLPTELLVHEVFPLLNIHDLNCLDVAVSDQRVRPLLLELYPFLRFQTHSKRGLTEHEMRWFFERRIPLSSISFSQHNTSDNITRNL